MVCRMSRPVVLRFIQVLPNANADGDFSLKDLPGSGGRIDILCRGLSACFDWGTETWSKEGLELIGALGSNRILRFRFPAQECRSERTWAEMIKRAMKGFTVEGIETREGSLEDCIGEIEALASSKIWVLDRTGVDRSVLKDTVDSSQNTFIIGDHLGFEDRAQRVFADHGVTKVSLGSTDYLSSHCIAAVISEIERLVT